MPVSLPESGKENEMKASFGPLPLIVALVAAFVIPQAIPQPAGAVVGQTYKILT